MPLHEDVYLDVEDDVFDFAVPTKSSFASIRETARILQQNTSLITSGTIKDRGFAVALYNIGIYNRDRYGPGISSASSTRLVTSGKTVQPSFAQLKTSGVLHGIASPNFTTLPESGHLTTGTFSVLLMSGTVGPLYLGVSTVRMVGTLFGYKGSTPIIVNGAILSTSFAGLRTGGALTQGVNIDLDILAKWVNRIRIHPETAMNIPIHVSRYLPTRER